MKRPSRKSSRTATSEPRLWTQSQARAAVPYLGSILRSLRDVTVEIHSRKRKLVRLDRLPGRPTRDMLIAQMELRNELDHLSRQLADTATELETLGVGSAEPIQGQVLLPFSHDQRLAWFLFDLFDNNPLRWWRYQDDPDDFRRPVTPAQSGLLAMTV